MPKNNHYVPRFLTSPWEIDQRRLVCCDTANGRIWRPSSKSLFARIGLNSDPVEDWFARIESRVAEARDRIRESATTVGLVSARSFPGADMNTIISLLMLQLHRAGTVHVSQPFVMPLDELTTQEPDWVDNLAHGARMRAAFFLTCVDTDLLFPEGAFFMLPLAGAPDATYAFPLAPDFALIAAPRSLTDEQLKELHATLVDERTMSALSAGLGRFGRRVIIPPSWSEGMSDAELVETVADCQRIAVNRYKLAATGTRHA